MKVSTEHLLTESEPGVLRLTCWGGFTSAVVYMQLQKSCRMYYNLCVFLVPALKEKKSFFVFFLSLDF